MTYDLRKELRTIDEFIDIDVIATKIRRVLRLTNVAAAYVFKKTFGELNGFVYDIEGGNSDIDLDSSLMEIQKYVTNKTSVVFNYKITCDNGQEKYSSLNFRDPRRRFLNEMIEFINSRSLKNKLNISKIEYKEEAGGKNPRLYIQLRYNFKRASTKKPGTFETKTTNINFIFALKYAGDASKVKALATLKPSNIVPSILDRWMTPREMYTTVISYINGSSFPTTDINLKKDYIKAVTNSYNNSGFTDDLGIAPDLSSEFFEILSCLKIGKLLESNNNSMKEIVGHPSEEPITKVELYIPKAANEALIDYKVAVNGQHDSPLKISVKSKVRGSSTATVKFSTAFPNGEAEVHAWFKGLKYSRAKNYNIGQRMIASSAMEYSKYSKKDTMYPIRALRKLLSSSKSSSVSSDFNHVMDTKYMNAKEWKDLITVLDKKVPSVRNFEPLDNLISDPILLIKTKKMIAENLFPGSSSKISIMRSLVSASYEEAERRSPSNKYPFSLNNIALMCERVLVKTSHRNGSSKFNFYKLFYDQVLKKQAVVYSVTERDTINGVEKLIHTFRSTRNFKQYEKWISLRTKNYANYMGDALGMGV